MSQPSISTSTLPVTERNEFEVIVLGGGPSGCTAAAAAARAGAKTLLIESGAFLGGSATAALVPAWCPFSDKIEQIYCGLASDVFWRCKEGTWGSKKEQLDWVPIDAEWLKVVYDDLMEEHGVTVRFHTQMVQVEAHNGEVQRVITASKAGLEAWSAGVFIDCTGDADVCARAGAAFHKGDDRDGALQPATMCFVLDNVNVEAYRNGPPLHNSFADSPIHKIVAEGKYPRIPDVHFCQDVNGPASIGFNAGHVQNIDNTDPDSVSRGLAIGRRMVQEYRDALQEYIPDVFGEAHISATGSQIGIRETRRIVGDYVLCADDWFNRQTFEDEICRNAYFIDIHGSDLAKLARERGQSTRYEPGEQHGVPYRCLCPKDLRNVLVAGRSVSTDRTVQGSTRVMPVCLAMGEAAGMAAAQAVRENDSDVHAVDVAKLREGLRAAGAYLPSLKTV